MCIRDRCGLLDQCRKNDTVPDRSIAAGTGTGAAVPQAESYDQEQCHFSYIDPIIHTVHSCNTFFKRFHAKLERQERIDPVSYTHLAPYNDPPVQWVSHPRE